MHKLTLSSEQIAKLKIVHRATKKKRDADRIKAIVLLSQGWTFVQVAQALLIDEETICNYLKCYKAKGVKGLLKNNFKGTESKLSKKELRQLDKRLQNETYLTVQEIVLYVKATFKIKYSISGMTELLHQYWFCIQKAQSCTWKSR